MSFLCFSVNTPLTSLDNPGPWYTVATTYDSNTLAMKVSGSFYDCNTLATMLSGSYFNSNTLPMKVRGSVNLGY